MPGAVAAAALAERPERAARRAAESHQIYFEAELVPSRERFGSGRCRGGEAYGLESSRKRSGAGASRGLQNRSPAPVSARGVGSIPMRFRHAQS